MEELTGMVNYFQVYRESPSPPLVISVQLIPQLRDTVLFHVFIRDVLIHKGHNASSREVMKNLCSGPWATFSGATLHIGALRYGSNLLTARSRYRVSLQGRHPRPVPGDQGGNPLLWPACRELAVCSDFGFYGNE